jgi:ketosteroid isomerase-like protein
MTKLTRVLIIVLLALAPTGAVFADPVDEASAVIDHWAAAYNANDADAVVKLYAQDGILLGTTSPLLAEGTGPI